MRLYALELTKQKEKISEIVGKQKILNGEIKLDPTFYFPTL